MKQSSLNFCPVPLEQQPLNEYQALRESWFFQWVTFPKFKYARKLTLVWAISLFITAPIAAASFPPQEATIGFILSSILGSSLFVGVALLRLYLGWSYIGDRLNQEKIIYEESGWYDGQEWEKPTAVLMRDRLIFSYQVKPMLKRLQKSGLIFLGLISSGSLIFLWI
jgi:hypothetical protein